jgi:hypothetical protein
MDDAAGACAARSVLAALGGQEVQITLTPHCCDALLLSYATVPREHGLGQGYHWAGARTVARGAVTMLPVRRSWILEHS